MIKVKYIAAAVIVLVFTMRFIPESDPAQQLLAQNPSQEYHLLIMKIKKDWKVVSAQDTTRTTVRVKKGDKIIWTAHGSDVYMQFIDQKLFGKYTQFIADGDQLRVTVGNLAKKGNNPYAVFCTADMQFATGDSPPVIIVD